ncbi:hypothetical protein QTJ16_005567 [Diplocarpon rosae]|uniref:Uncharacterized protein n=1 Tax=Diplocarpon rosae TaxID=946125 RepID=A0AAD9SXZ3_9HELO|nr:hypothetical protein QTJ16_005567 [Diplocarpon rosae]
MNRYARGPTIGAPSKATASTLCQKCLKRDEYMSPSMRLQALTLSYGITVMNAKQWSKNGVADELLAKADQERGRKRERQSDDPELRGATKRVRSTSATSASVSSISTGISRSPSPRPARKSTRRSISPPRRRTSPSMSVAVPRGGLADSEKKRKRDSFSSVDSYSSVERQQSRDRANTRRRYQKASPPARGRTTESRSPFKKRQDSSHDRQRPRNLIEGSGNTPLPPRERSLSPFSKRLALTQAMNGGGR